MSYVVTIKRQISKTQLLAAVEGDAEFTVRSGQADEFALEWKSGDESAIFDFFQGEIIVTTPSDAAFVKMQQLSEKLDAKVVGEEDADAAKTEIPSGIFTNRTTWIGWPLIVVALTILLIMKW